MHRRRREVRRVEMVSAIWMTLGSLLSPLIGAQVPCPANPNPQIWHVHAQAQPTVADGTRAKPLASLKAAVNCADVGATIHILYSDRALPGGVVLKDGQRLLGEMDRDGEGRSRITATEGDAIVLAHNNEVAWLHLEVANGVAVFGDNVAGSDLHDLHITRLRSGLMARLDPSLCHVVLENGAFDHSASVIRGCNGRLEPLQKGAITLLADGKHGPSVLEHSIRRTTIEDIPGDTRENLWGYGIDVQVAGDVTVTVVIEGSTLTGMEGGIAGKGRQSGALTLLVTDTSVDDLLRDGIVVSTGFHCSGLRPEVRFDTDCRGREWVPESDAKVVLHAEGYRYADSRCHGLIDDASAIEFYALDQGRSEIEIHVQDSDLIGAAQPAVFNFNVYGYPARQIIDLGCRNPAPGDPQRIREDRMACNRAGYTSAGRNRLFGNAWGGDWSSDLSEVALVGPGRMMAQGNYWGDRAPIDGLGDALGDCSRLNWLDEEPIYLTSDARCELWHVPGYIEPDGIDGRFHLVADPRR